MAIPYVPYGTSILAVDHVLLPLGIEINVTGGPRTKTAITESASGKRRRFSYFNKPRREYSGAFGPEYVAELLDIWIAGLGPRYGLMLRDPFDYSFADVELSEIFITGGSAFQLRKAYRRVNYFTDAAVRTHYRDILLPDPETITVYVNGEVNTSFTLVDDGVIESATVFDATDVVTASGEFFVPVEFAGDELDLTGHASDISSIQQVKFIEVLPGDLP